MKYLNFFTMSDKSIESEKTLGAKFPFTGLSYATENDYCAAQGYTFIKRQTRLQYTSPLESGASFGSISRCLLSGLLIILFLLTLSAGANAQLYWSGTQNISDGSVINDNIVLTGNVTVNVSSGSATIRGIISGNYNFSKGGSGDLYLTANNTYTGSTNINNGNLRLDGSGNLINTSGVSVSSGSWLVFDNNTNITFTRTISGSGGVARYGAANTKVILTATNTYSNRTLINNGTLQVGNGSTGSINNTSRVELMNDVGVFRLEPGSGDLVFSKAITGPGKAEFKAGNGGYIYLQGVCEYTGTTTVDPGGNGIVVTSIAGNIINNGAVTFFYYSNYTYSGVISGTGSVRKGNDTGTTTFTGVNTYTGQTIVYGGTLVVGNGTRGSINNTSSVDIHSGCVLYFRPGVETNFDKVISGAGRVVIDNTTSIPFRLNANNTYNGTTTLTAGSSVSIGGGTNAGSVVGNIELMGNAQLNLNRSNDWTYAGNISGTSVNCQVAKWGAGKITLTGKNSYLGRTYVGGGTLQIGNGTNTASGIEQTSNIEIAEGAVLRFEPALNLTVSKVISGAGRVEYKGDQSDKRLYLTANNTYTGTTTVEIGGLLIGNFGTTGAIAGNIINNGHLNFIRSNAYTYSGVISGTGIVLNGGNAALTLNGANTYTGSTQIGNNTIILGASGSIENSNSINFTHQNSKLDISAGDKKVKAISTSSGITNCEIILGARRLTIGTAGQADGGYTYVGRITGTGSIRKLGGAELSIAHTTYTGGTIIESGRLSIWGEHASNIVVNDNVVFANQAARTYSGTISGTGTVHKTQPFPLTFTGVHTYTGYTNVWDGALVLSASGSIENTAHIDLCNDGAKLDISAGDKRIRDLRSRTNNSEVVLGSRTLTIGISGQNNGGGNFSGIISGSGSVTKTGTANLILSGQNTATGTLTLQQGKLTLASRWQRNFIKNAGTELEIQGNVTIGGTATISGGNIYMNLKTDPPAKMVVNGVMNPSGINTLHINCNNVANQALFQAASGIIASPFTLAIPGSLEATGTQLLLTAAATSIDQLGIGNYELSIYPNPTTGQLRITNYELRDGVNIELFDVFGRCVETWRAASLQDGTINISNLPAGVYMLRVGNKSVRVVKQ